MNKKMKDIIVMGLALFAMFFGASNLIFPPILGKLSGAHWTITALGFFATAVGLPLMGIIAVTKVGGGLEDIGNSVSPLFSKVFGTIIILAIGPLLAIPRLGATTYEIAVEPFTQGIHPLVISIVFFGITLFFSMKPSKIMDIIGKYLTPILLIIVILIIIKGIVVPIGNITLDSNMGFSKGFVEGYQTMDALAAMIFGGIMVMTAVEKGYSSKKEQVNLIVPATIVAAALLALIYGGLMYLGATSSQVYADVTDKTALLVAITHHIFGGTGKIVLALTTALACLTTSIGLTATCAAFFRDLLKDKISYKALVIFICVFSGVFATVGVEVIVNIAVPLLVLVYPVATVLIVFNVFKEIVPKNAYLGATIGAGIIGLLDSLKVIGIQLSFANSLYNMIPLADMGFAWLIPAIIGAVLTTVIGNK